MDLLDRLTAEGLSILVRRDEQDLYSSTLNGIRPLLELLDWFPAGLAGAVVADRLVGACAARILAHLRPREVLALRGTIEAGGILFAANIEFTCRETIPYVSNRDGNGPCPFEIFSSRYDDIYELIQVVREKLQQTVAGTVDKK